MNRIGFCCKYVAAHKKNVFENVEGYNTGSTTAAWLGRQPKEAAEQRLWDLMIRNIAAAQRLVEKVGSFDQQLRMVRLGSDLLAMYTHRDWKYFYQRADVQAVLDLGFAQVGAAARRLDVRLSFHPSQYVVLASASEGIVDNSIAEFEYHADMARWMGYGKTFQDFKINVHISGRQGPDGIRKAYKRLSPEARNCITIENEEISHNLDTCLQLADLLPIVLDGHHHWINSGEYIQVDDSRVEQVIASWRGVVPAMHYSVSREDILVDHARDKLPCMADLLALGHKKQHLRAHSDFYWNTAVNEWAATFSEHFDIQCESKCKNLASFEFAESLK